MLLGEEVIWGPVPKPQQAGTIKSIDRLLPEAPRDAAINPLILVALILQEVLQEVQHLGHLQGTRTCVAPRTARADTPPRGAQRTQAE